MAKYIFSKLAWEEIETKVYMNVIAMTQGYISLWSIYRPFEILKCGWHVICVGHEFSVQIIILF
jgi:hypothetical protein